MTALETKPDGTGATGDAPAAASPAAAPPAAASPVEEVVSDAPEVRRNTGAVQRPDVLALLGALVAAVCGTALIFTRLAPFSGKVGFAVVAYLLFLGFYALLVAMDQDGPMVRARLVAAAVHGLAVLLLAALLFIVLFTFRRGITALVHSNFFTQDLRNAGPLEGLETGGILHAIIGTLEMITIALAITIPLGLTCAVFLNEIPGRFSRFVRTVVEAMTALPSIVAGLFIYATFILALGFPLSGLAAALAITVMMLPIVIRAADVVIRLVPGSLREASLALGSGQWRTVWHVVLPTARSGLTTAVILGTARGIGETSPVLLTAGYTANINKDPTSGPMVSLPLVTYSLVRTGYPNMIARAFGTAAVLLALVLLLFVLARILGGRAPGDLTRRQESRRALQSTQDIARYREREEGAALVAGLGGLLPEETRPPSRRRRRGREPSRRWSS